MLTHSFWHLCNRRSIVVNPRVCIRTHCELWFVSEFHLKSLKVLGHNKYFVDDFLGRESTQFSKTCLNASGRYLDVSERTWPSIGLCATTWISKESSWVHRLDGNYRDFDFSDWTQVKQQAQAGCLRSERALQELCILYMFLCNARLYF